LWRYFTGDNTTEEYPGIYSPYISVGVYIMYRWCDNIGRVLPGYIMYRWCDNIGRVLPGYIMYRWCDNIGRVLPGTGVRNEENEDVTI
jgi:hypothetical protein